ncbi:MAG: GlxA family transcriptional regulator [Desulfobacterales bacterium]|nr:GlxA family transcriptional regulator [Desulfobacterales bacterium]
MPAKESTHKNNAKAPGNLSIGFILVSDFTLIAFAGFVAVLRHAADEGDRSKQKLCKWTIMGETLDPIKSSSGVEIIPWEPFKDPKEFDYVVIVGGLLPEDNRYDIKILNYLRKADRAGVPIIGVCTGSFYMAEAGLMEGKKTCVHWYHYHDFINAFPDLIPVTDEIFIEDKKMITCPGGSSVTDLALFIIERDLGKERAIKCLRHLLLNWGRPQNHPQLPFNKEFATISDPRVRKAVFLMEQNMSEPLTVKDIADHVHISPRQVERLFKLHMNATPLSYFRKIRLLYGKWLIENSEASVAEIAYECGFSDASHFTRWFKNEFSVTPVSVRRQMEEGGTLIFKPTH